VRIPISSSDSYGGTLTERLPSAIVAAALESAVSGAEILRAVSVPAMIAAMTESVTRTTMCARREETP